MEKEFKEYYEELNKHDEEVAEQTARDYLLIDLSVAQIYLGETVNVWVSGEEAPELATALEEEGAPVEEVLNRIKDKFPDQITVWVRKEDEDGSAYYLLPKFLAHYSSTQFVLHECPECGSRLGTARICYREPWDCSHGEYIYCARCGAESGLVGAIHGPQGVELNEEEVSLLLKFFEEDDEQ